MRWLHFQNQLLTNLFTLNLKIAHQYVESICKLFHRDQDEDKHGEEVRYNIAYFTHKIYYLKFFKFNYNNVLLHNNDNKYF